MQQSSTSEHLEWYVVWESQTREFWYPIVFENARHVDVGDFHLGDGSKRGKDNYMLSIGPSHNIKDQFIRNCGSQASIAHTQKEFETRSHLGYTI